MRNFKFNLPISPHLKLSHVKKSSSYFNKYILYRGAALAQSQRFLAANISVRLFFVFRILDDCLEHLSSQHEHNKQKKIIALGKIIFSC